MKRIFLFLAALMMVSGMAFSQSRSDFKGPKAKNYKAWQHTVETTELQIVSERAEVPKGPEAKNSNNILNAPSNQANVVASAAILNNQRLGMSGPKAKNFRSR